MASLLCDFSYLITSYYMGCVITLSMEHPVSACSDFQSDIFSDFPELGWDVSVRQVKRRRDSAYTQNPCPIACWGTAKPQVISEDWMIALPWPFGQRKKEEEAAVPEE